MNTVSTSKAAAYIKYLVSDYKKLLMFGCWGAGGGGVGSLLGEIVEGKGAGSFLSTVLSVGVWFAIIGGCVSTSLMLGSSFYLSKELRPWPAIKSGLPIGALSGFVSGAVAQGVFASLGESEFLRVVCWGLAGGLLGFGLSRRIPNLNSRFGIGGGSIGGLIGGTLFVALASSVDLIAARFFGIAWIGFLIGLVISVLETAFRDLWLEVSYGPGEMRTVTLGSQPVSIGSAQNEATVYVRDASPVACSYRQEQGRLLFEDRATGRTETVSVGDRRQIGSVVITVCGSPPKGFPAPQPISDSSRSSGLVLHLQGRIFPLKEGSRIDVESNAAGGVSTTAQRLAQVNRNPDDASVLGLKNQSALPWVVHLPNGVSRTIESGQSVRLTAGTHINFGMAEGDVRGQ